jgi:hypothetical protein
VNGTYRTGRTVPLRVLHPSGGDDALASYLADLGFSPIRVGAIITGTLLGGKQRTSHVKRTTAMGPAH